MRYPGETKSGGPSRLRASKPPHSKLGAFVPRGQVALLLGGKLVKAMAHGVELEACDLFVQMLRDDVHLWLEVLVIGAEVFGGKRLVRETHVHDGCGMSLGGGEIDEAAFCEEIDFAAVLHLKFVDHGADFALTAGQLLERGNVNLHVEVAGVADNRSALHFFEMLAADDILVSGHGDINVTFLHGFGHGHHAEAVHRSFDALHGVDFGDDHVGAEALGAHGHAAATPAVTGNHDFKTGE